MTSWTASLHVLTNCCCKMAVHPMVHQDGAAQAILPAAKVDDTLVAFKHQFSTFFCQDESCQSILWKATAYCFSLMRTGCVMAELEQSPLHKLILTASFQYNRLPFLFLGLIFGGPFSLQFWFFTPTYGVLQGSRTFAIYLHLDFTNMYAAVVM